MDGAAALLGGLAAVLVALTGLLALLFSLRPKPPEADDDTAAWRDRALAAEQRAAQYEQRWLDCLRARGAPPSVDR